MLETGTGKADITAYVKGVGMLGYGMHFNTMEGVETSLSARAIVFRDSDSGVKMAFVNCELCFVTIALKKGVLKHLQRHYPEWGYDDDNLMLTAQHTHSGPGGYSFYGFYNLSIPGFHIEVYQKIVSGIVQAIIQAEADFEPSHMVSKQAEFDPSVEIAFNRSIEAYNSNPEVTEKITQETAQLGVDRKMSLLAFFRADGSLKASVNWFGVHTTSLPNTNKMVNYDNKGYAAAFLEDYFSANQNKPFVGIFAQGNCGDVTPRFRYNSSHPYQRGKYEGKFPDDLESTRYNGRLQFEKALEIIQSMNSGSAEKAELDFEIMYVNFSDILCDPAYTGGVDNARTGPACLGTAFFGGTVIDGPGMHPVLTGVTSMVSRLIRTLEKLKARFGSERYRQVIERKYSSQDPKQIMVETHARRVLGTRHINRLIVPAFIDPSIATLKYFYRKTGYRDVPWTPKVMPIQMFVLGEIALAAFPFEITVIASKRLTESLQSALAARGVKQVILVPYANSYSGYITTAEEYRCQIYEGGHNVFGVWSLAALQTRFDQLCAEMIKPKPSRKIPHDAIPPDFTEEELSHFPFYKRAWYLRQELIQARRMERRG